MKRQAWLSLIFTMATSLAHAEPVFMPQAVSVLKAHEGEIGIGGQFGYALSETDTRVGTTDKSRVWHFPLLARYGVTDTIESRLLVPITSAIDSSEGSVSSRHVDSGFGNIQVGTKWNFLKEVVPLAAVLDLDLPTANPQNNPAPLGWRYSRQYQQGFNTHVQLVGDIPLLPETLTGHAQVGYMNTGTYTTSANARFNPSDLVTFGASLDLNLKTLVDGLSVSGEFVGNSALNHSKTGGTANGNDKGSVLEAGPALRYQTGSVRTWAGFLVDAGPATFQAYNYRVNFGASWLWGSTH